MNCKLVPLTREHLSKIVKVVTPDMESYFTPGSTAYCILDDDEPVFAGGVVNLQWCRGELWIQPTPWFRRHIKTCYRYMYDNIPLLAARGGFRRLQAVCTITTSTNLFAHLKLESEGVMRLFGPNGEDCHMYSRLFGGENK